MVDLSDESPKNESTPEGERKNKISYNQKWDGYLGIMLSSLVNFASIADVSADKIYDIQLELNRENFEAIFGAVSFIVSLLILVFDRVHVLQRKFDFKTVSDGKLEGSVLLVFVIWWIVGVGIMTRAGGVAYTILNTYFSCWYTLGMSVWTLNKWTTAKDIISIHQLTRLSKTLPYWYILFFASLVGTGSGIDVFAQINEDVNTGGKKEYSISIGAISVLFTTIAILAHYKLLCCSKIKPGGKLEISAGIILCIWWILGVSVLTTGQELASTIQGVSIQGVTMYPGSNLYLSLWLGLYGSVNICLEWKAAHAMKQLTKLTLQTVENRSKIQTNEDDV